MTIREYKQLGGQGLPWASEARPELPLPDKDGRHYALQKLADYLASLTFFMTGTTNGPLVSFQIPAGNIFTSWPDNEELLDKGEDDFPRVAFEGLEQTEDYPGFTAHEIPDTDDLYGQGTILFLTSEHVETLTMHITCRSIAERRAVLAGLMYALNPSQDFVGLRFKLTDYFNATCRFTLETGGRREDPDAARNRRTIQLQLTLRVPNIFCVNIERMTVVSETNVGGDVTPDPNGVDKPATG